MATRDELYCKFGMTAEAAQLFETELTTLLLGVLGMSRGWHIVPDPAAAEKLARRIDAQTLGALFKRVESVVRIDAELKGKLASAVRARNRLIHGFFERHNFRIQSSEGRDLMIADLDTLHAELVEAWQLAGAMSQFIVDQLRQQRADFLKKKDLPLSGDGCSSADQADE